MKMKLLKNLQLKLAFISLFTMFYSQSEAQCNASQLESTAYFTGSCGNLFFQSSIGSTDNSFGSCGNLYFTPPLTGGDVTTLVQGITFEEVSIRPNPVIDKLEIIYDVRSVITGIAIFNATGQMVFLSEKPEISHFIDIQSLIPGIYFIQIKVRGVNPVIKKFVKL